MAELPEVLNLDAMSKDQLLSLWSHLMGKFQDTCFHYKIERADGKILTQYASEKYSAIKYRELGMIPNAIYQESLCEKLYNQLSEEAKW